MPSWAQRSRLHPDLREFLECAGAATMAIVGHSGCNRCGQGLLTTVVSSETAPVRASARPSRLAPVPTVIEMSARIVP